MSHKYVPALRATSLALAAGLSAPMSQARPPAGGTDISNTASVTYLNTRLGLTESVQSNSVLTRVGDVPAIAITSDQTFVRAPGDNALFAFQIENTGNVAVSVNPEFGDFGGNFDFTRAIAYVDRNENGQIDAADERLADDMEIDLDIAARAGILVDIRVPDTAEAGASAFGILEATITSADTSGVAGSIRLSSSGPSAKLSVNEVAGVRGMVIVTNRVASLQKSTSVTDNRSGGEITYTLNLRNNSDDPILPSAVCRF